jgi:hypothetical protein
VWVGEHGRIRRIRYTQAKAIVFTLELFDFGSDTARRTLSEALPDQAEGDDV